MTKIISSLAIFIAAFLVAWLFLVYPNDLRVKNYTNPNTDTAKTQILVKKDTMFLSKLNYQHSMPTEEYHDYIQKLDLPKNYRLIHSSKRFASPYQIFLSIGFYPRRMEAYDAIVIPPGKELKLNYNQLSSTFLNFHGVAPRGKAILDVSINKTPLTTITLENLKTPPDTQSWYYKYFLKYLWINIDESYNSWFEYQSPKLPLNPSTDFNPQSTITFSCRQESLGPCVVSDPIFYQHSSPAKKPQNFLVILLDTWRSDALDSKSAPTLGSFAKSNINFTKTLAPGNMTSPSSNAILSCQKPSNLQAVGFSYAVSEKDREHHYEKDTPSFAQVFSQNNYLTSMIGNISLISEVYGVGVHHGFEQNISIESEAYDTPQITHETLKWLDKNHDKKFFLYVHLDGGHAPYRPPLSYLWQSRSHLTSFSSMPVILKWLYESELAYTDYYLAKIFSSLKNLNLDENTHVVVTSDHGDQQTEHKFNDNVAGPLYSGAYFDHGATLLNDEIAVPLAIKIPGEDLTKTPRKIETFVTNLSLGPTLLDLAHLPIPTYCSAQSLMPYLQNTPTTKHIEEILGFEGFRARGILFEQRFKYIRSYELTDKVLFAHNRFFSTKSQVFIPEELYDLGADPGENTNLAVGDFSLLQKARMAFARYYGFEDAYEIIIEPKQLSKIVVALNAEHHLLQIPEGMEHSQVGEKLVLTGNLSQRTVITIKTKFLEELPLVYINGQKMLYTFTRYKLPIEPKSPLPAEFSGLAMLFSQTEANTVYLRRVMNDNMPMREINTGNLEFENVLREWGYLQDDKK